MQNAVTNAVKQLRLALGDTQQQFAARTGLAISTVVRYELSRPPRGEALLPFRKLAQEHGLRQICLVFDHAIGQTAETDALAAAVHSLWWNRDIFPAESLNKLLEDLQGLIAVKQTNPELIPETEEELRNQIFHLSILMHPTNEEINAAVSQTIERNPGMTWEIAYPKTLLENPELYARHQQRRNDAIRARAGRTGRDKIADRGAKL